ncbi:ATP-dependent DNA helicase RecG [uncultured Actinomyces sp.]|uniref:ATP-dependent DNA helicase RecG n=1 Tax=uncultured Actinomyces sp. TaxID=249061 RepID=UPI00260E1CD8|nr:ATP-dependent DNA helicase RecG [uncultured Actinomyces sp.]
MSASVPSKPQLLDSPLDRVLGPRTAKKIASLGLETAGDLLMFFPRRYGHWGKLTPLAAIHEGEDVTLLAQVESAQMVRNRNGGVRLSVELTDGYKNINATFFARHPGALSVHERMLVPGSSHLFAGKVSSYRGRLQLTHPDFERFERGDAKDRVDRPIPIYAANSKCPSWLTSKSAKIITAMVQPGDVLDPIPMKLREDRDLMAYADALVQLHDPQSDQEVTRAKLTVRWAEALTLQTALLRRRARAKKDTAPRIEAGQAFAQAKAELPFTLTSGQEEALGQILADMAGEHPMQKLLQADVGAGKTVVAGLAMTATVDAGYQAALLAPTEVLAAQHAVSLSKMLPVPVELLTGSSKSKHRGDVSTLASSGQAAVFVGTHALIQDSLQFSNLGLVVVDEQHRFGVSQRDRLRAGGQMVPHMLTMTATPIPRTIAMTVFGDLDALTIRELPTGRKQVQTFLVDATNAAWNKRMWERAREEVEAGGRVFVVAPRIDSTDGDDSQLANVVDTREMLAILPQLGGVKVGLLHGGMSASEKTVAIERFDNGITPILVTTTVIEVGVDISAASMMVILDAQQFGLSQLHQLRGRVGRGGQQAICMAHHRTGLAPESMKRLEAFASTTDGFALAEADLKLRREGNVLGENQSGVRTSLKALRVTRDGAIIEAARTYAGELLEEDNDLRDYPQLLQAANRMGEAAEWMERS